MNNLYDTLGVDSDATESQIKAAYREKARETHPDHNPDSEEFTDVNTAYGILSSSDKRNLYDKTGMASQLSEDDLIKEQAAGHIVMMVQKIVADIGDNVFENDIVKMMSENCVQQEKGMVSNLKKIGRECSRWKKVRSRISFEGDHANLMAQVCDNQIHNIKMGIGTAKFSLKVMGRVREMLEDYAWEFKEKEEAQIMFGTIGSTSPLGRSSFASAWSQS